MWLYLLLVVSLAFGLVELITCSQHSPNMKITVNWHMVNNFPTVQLLCRVMLRTLFALQPPKMKVYHFVLYTR